MVSLRFVSPSAVTAFDTGTGSAKRKTKKELVDYDVIITTYGVRTLFTQRV